MSPKKCSVVGCEETSHLFSLPKDESVRKHWEDYLVTAHISSLANESVCTKNRLEDSLFRAGLLGADLCVCARHFTEDCFDNRAQFSAGYSTFLKLKNGAFPSIKNECKEETDELAISLEELPLTSMKERASPAELLPCPPLTANVKTDTSDLISTRSIEVHPSRLMLSTGTQCHNNVSTSSVGTQSSIMMLSTGTQCCLNIPTSSIGTQYSIMMLSIGTQCDLDSTWTKIDTTQLANNTPMNWRSKGEEVGLCCKGKCKDSTKQHVEFQQPSSPRGIRPEKRPRIEHSQEEEEECISDISQSDVSLTERSETRESQSTRGSDQPKYIVFENCLRDLFKTCPRCRQECEMQQQRLGTSLSFSQFCPNCKYSRKWQNQPVEASIATDPS